MDIKKNTEIEEMDMEGTKFRTYSQLIPHPLGRAKGVVITKKTFLEINGKEIQVHLTWSDWETGNVHHFSTRPLRYGEHCRFLAERLEAA